MSFHVVEDWDGMRHLRTDFQRKGYCRVQLDLPDELIENIKRDVEQAPEKYRSQRQHERDDNARIFQAWRYSPAVWTLATWPYLLDTVHLITGRRPFPFQTLNFKRGSQQALHQDAIHFDADPPGHMVGTWVALEDVDESCGPLIVCPGSHVEPRWDFRDLGYGTVQYGEEEVIYPKYEAFMAKLAERYLQELATLGKGEALIWHGNLIHGGAPITREGATRWSQATHMYLGGAERHYCPMFGTDKDMEGLDIMGYREAA